MSSGHIENLLNAVDASVNNYVFSVYAGISSEMNTTLRLMFILFFVIYGLSLSQGWIQSSIQDFIRHFFKFTLVFIFATNWNYFNQLFYTLFTDSPNYLGGVMLASAPNSFFQGVSNVNSVLGGIYDQGLYAASIMLFESDTWNIAIKATGLLTGVMTLLMVAYAAFLVAIGKIATAVLLGLSPLFIAFLVFRHTRGLFEGWLRQLMNFALIPVITYGILIFAVTLTSPAVKQLADASKAGNASTNFVFPFLLASAVSIILLKQAMGIAAGIAGGIQLSALGTVGSAVASIWRHRHHGKINLPKKAEPTNSITNKQS